MLNAKKFISLFLILCASIAFVPAKSQEVSVPSDSLLVAGQLQPDSLATDSVPALEADTIAPEKKASLEARVDYQAHDSIIMIGRNMVYLFGEANVKYETMELTGERIEIDTDYHSIYATFGIDSVGGEFGYPVFKDGGSEYESKTMRYNFKTKKAYVTDVITQQGDGFITARLTKKMADNVMFMRDGKYTTCDNHDHPHFYLQLTRAKVRTGKDIVAGPAYLVIADVPLPVALPFGFFPFTESYSSGILMPSYGDEMTRGFFLRDGGYYFAFSDFIDLALTGEIYTKGSWGLTARSSYRKRYRYSGSFNSSYLKTITGDKGIDYSSSTDYRISWTHSQDPKANPFQVLSAQVNYSSSTFNRNSVNTIYNSDAYTANTKASSINYTQRFPDNPWTLSANISASQSSRDSSVSVTLPNLNINMSTVFPFRRKQAIGKERWYEKVSLTYSGSLQNSINTREDQLFKSNLIKDWENRFTHNVPVSATFNVLKYINITPSLSYRERWFSNRVTRNYDTKTRALVPVDTIWGFNRVWDYNTSLGINTKLFGFYKPWSVFGDRVQMIRHVFTPTFSISAHPDFGAERYGFWREVNYIDAYGNLRSQWYTPFREAPGRGKSGSLNFSFQNNLEMKIKSDSDSTGVRKISLIDNLSLSGSYNMAADSMRWSTFNTSVRLKLSKTFTLNLNATLDPYTYREDGTQQDVMRWEDGRGFARLMNTGTAFSYTFNNESTRKLWEKLTGQGKGEDSSSSDSETPPSETGDETETTGEEQPRGSLRERKESKGEFDADGYMKVTIPWSLSFSYGLNLSYDRANFNPVKREFPYLITQNLSFSGNIAPAQGWNFNFSTSYDFDSKRLVYMSCNASRNLHCWSMSAGFIPIGPYKSYNFTISVNSSLLQDLKYEQSSNFRDAMQWY